MRCLEKERVRRYPSANQLADEVERFLNGLPVDAAPPSLAYRVRKLAARHSLAVAAVGAVLIALVVGAAGTTIGLVRANRANSQLTDALVNVQREAERARDAERLAALSAEEATRQGDIARAINEFFTKDLLAAARPSSESGAGRDVTLREVLDVAARELDDHGRSPGRFAGMPAVEGEIRNMLGAVYTELGEVDSAILHLQRAVALRAETLGPSHPDTLSVQRDLATQLSRIGRLAESEALLTPVVEGHIESLGATHSATLLSRRDLGMLRYRQGRNDEAYAILRETFADAETHLSPLATTTLNVLASLAIVAHAVGDDDEAEAAFRESLARRLEAYGPEEPDTISARVNLAAFLRTLGRNDEARQELLEGLEQQRAVFGAEHPATGTTLFNLGTISVQEGRFEEGEAYLRESLAINSKALGETHPTTLLVTVGLAHALVGLERRNEAEILFRKAYELSVETVGPEHPATDSRRQELAGFLFHVPEAREEVVQLLEDSYELQRTTQGPTHPSTLRSLMNLGMLHTNEDRFEVADRLLREAVTGFSERYGPDHPEALNAESALAGNLLSQERLEEALEIAQRTVQVGERVMHPDSVDLARLRMRLALTLKELGAKEDAYDLFEVAYKAMLAARGPGDVQVRFAREQLTELEQAGGGSPDDVD